MHEVYTFASQRGLLLAIALRTEYTEQNEASKALAHAFEQGIQWCSVILGCTGCCLLPSSQLTNDQCTGRRLCNALLARDGSHVGK